MPRTKTKNTPKTATVAGAVAKKTPAKKAKRAARGSVGDTILSLLANGAKTRKQLLEEGGFSPASLFNVLKVLKKQGTVVISADNRLVSAAGGAIAAVSAPVIAAPKAVKKSVTKALVPAGQRAAHALQEALDSVQRLFKAPEGVHEKLLTLDHLIETLPAPISSVLTSIREDYVRLSSSKTPF